MVFLRLVNWDKSSGIMFPCRKRNRVKRHRCITLVWEGHWTNWCNRRYWRFLQRDRSTVTNWHGKSLPFSNSPTLPRIFPVSIERSKHWKTEDWSHRTGTILTGGTPDGSSRLPTEVGTALRIGTSLCKIITRQSAYFSKQRKRLLR